MGGSRAGKLVGQRAGREVVAGQEVGQSRDDSRRNQRGCYLNNLSWEPCLSLPLHDAGTMAPWSWWDLGLGRVVCLYLPQSQAWCKYCSVCG